MGIPLLPSKAIRLMACSLAVLGVNGLGCGGTAEHSVATVGRSPIFQEVLDHWTSVSAAVGPDSHEGAKSARKRALELLIVSRWLTAEASEARVEVSSAESKKQLKLPRYDQLEGSTYHPLPKDSQLRALLTSPHVAPSDRLWLMRMSMLAARVEGRRYSQAQKEITREQITSFDRHNRRSFVQRAWREIEILGNYHKTAVAKAKGQIEAGADFLSLARRVSIVPEAPNGLQSMAHGEEEPPFDKVVFAAMPGALVGPDKNGFYFIFKVLRARPERQLTLAGSEKDIRLRLADERASGELLSVFERKWISRTSCRPAFVVSKCRQYVRVRKGKQLDPNLRSRTGV